MASNEMFVWQPEGSRSDAELHEPILAAGNVDAAKAITRRRMRERGWSETEIDSWLNCTAADAQGDRVK